MNKNNMIGIVATIKEKPQLVIDARDWKLRVYETEIERRRPDTDTFDTFILRYSGKSAGAEETLERIDEGVEVLIAGEVRSKNIKKPTDEENRVKIYIFAEVIAINNPPADQQNDVFLRGRICKEPRARQTRRKKYGKKIAITDIIVAVNGKSGSHYIPCVCWYEQARTAEALKVDTYVEVTGRLQSREFIKHIKDKKTPFLCKNYEVSVCELSYENEDSGSISEQEGDE